ncbi:MAG: segregation/condensation protein A [Lachnospiraceae bacterium]|jgi:segregation and condensation protein A|nr:segregation/condensation protein A [Lachnospiraceae bacterium]
MKLEFKLEAFEGPLDLLLHLIEKNKVDIYDIPIVEITSQYMDYINAMETEDMGVMSEFLLMAATLLDIKCKMLLPKEETDEEEEEIDPRADLVQQLLEYKMYKSLSYMLRDKELSGQKSFYKDASLPKEVKNYIPPIDLEELVGDNNLDTLSKIFDQVMKRQAYKVDPVRSKFGNIKKEEVTVEEKVSYLSGYLKEHDKCNFKDLLVKQSSRIHIVTTFLAVLEMIKTGEILVKQDNIFDEIWIKSKVN